MSEPLALVSVLAGVLSLSGTVLSKSLSVRDTIDLLRARWKRKVKQLEPYELSGVMYVLLLPITDTLTTMEQNVLYAENETVLDYRARRMAGCSMTGVAAALIAQLTNTSLEHEYTNELPWIVRALWICGLVLSLLSAYYSFLLHQYLTSFATAQELRRDFTHRTFRSAGAKGVKLPSLTVAVKLWVPPYLVSLAIGCYVITLGLYWGFAWTQWWRVAEDGGRQVENRNIFVFYILAMVFATVLFTVPSAIGAILEDLDGLHLYRGELGHVCRAGNAESGRRTEEGSGFGETPSVGGSARDSSDVQEPYKSHGSSAVPGSAVLGYSFPESVGSLGANGPLRGVGAAVAALLVAAEAHRNTGLASRNVAAELEQLVDSLAEGGYARGDHRSGEA